MSTLAIRPEQSAKRLLIMNIDPLATLCEALIVTQVSPGYTVYVFPETQGTSLTTETFT